ncbi:uncharacterized protein LOC106467821 [Limulus polyphemus]|uniref:Uncharacterized protein LOC106467821 n=1 Tax=Limulus polyphemus TaxID=6850 RepID=A0ABM1BK92_LIMPO|nr:uncharacterized protein LOC106467821 [Limulus polyphemus]XP_022251719.1 uncharacterized protein LOC106467821 [Limulus polyphemus]
MEVHSLEKLVSFNSSVVQEGECFVASLEVSRDVVQDVGATMEVVNLISDERAEVPTTCGPNKSDYNLEENVIITPGVWDDVEQLVKKACSDFQDVPGPTDSQLLVSNSCNDVKKDLHFTENQNLTPKEYAYVFKSSEGEKSRQAANVKKASKGNFEKTKIRRTRQLIDVEACRKPFELGWKREIVYRSSTENNINRKSTRLIDVYYLTPSGQRLRSMREVYNYISAHPQFGITIDCFTFANISISHTPYEIQRHAYSGRRGSSLSPAGQSVRTLSLGVGDSVYKEEPLS